MLGSTDEELKKIKLEQMKEELNSIKLEIRIRKCLSLASIVAAPISYVISRELSVASRGTENYGGEIVIPMILVVVAAFIYPYFKVPDKYNYLSMSRTSNNHVDIDLRNSDKKCDVAYSDNGTFDIIDNSGEHHMIKLFDKR